MNPASSTQGVIHVDYAVGNLGNKMLQYLTALKLADHLPGFELSGIEMKEWGIDIPPRPQRTSRRLRYSADTTVRLDFDDIARRVQERKIERVELNIYSSHIHNLIDVARARPLFALAPQAEGYGGDVLLINVRASEILNAVHSEYTVLPVAFYEDLIARTGLRPVFLGQIGGQSRYLDSLRAAFPHAEFVDSRGAVFDFSVIAKSKNVVMAVSTFSWLAGWLSEADRIIMPLSGFMNPLQYPLVDLLPPGDGRFEYWLFPENHAVLDADIEAAHLAMAGQWRPVSFSEIDRLRDIPPAAQPEAAPTLSQRIESKVRRLWKRVA